MRGLEKSIIALEDGFEKWDHVRIILNKNLHTRFHLDSLQYIRRVTVICKVTIFAISLFKLKIWKGKYIRKLLKILKLKIKCRLIASQVLNLFLTVFL